MDSNLDVSGLISPKNRIRSSNNFSEEKTEADHFASIIQHLRDDIYKQYPEEQMPSNWIITCLVRNLYNRSMKGRPWEENIYRLLMNIASFANTAEGKDQAYFSKTLQKSLFPELNYFSPKHAMRFATFSIIQLRKSTSKSTIWKM